MDLRETKLKDEQLLEKLYAKIIENVSMDDNYLILVGCDTYDVPFKSKDDSFQKDNSDESFTYLVCSICPVKQTKPALGYLAEENRFCNLASDWVIAAPELGFMFPAFERRAANIYSAFYYTHDTAENHLAFVDALFGAELPLPAAVQKETFSAILAESVAEDCSYAVAQSVHEQLCELAEVKKAAAAEDDEPEVPMVSKRMVRSMLEDCGVTEERIHHFEERYDAEFGAATELPPANLIDRGKFSVKTPDVVIQVKPEASDLVQTRMINGEKYILIRAEAGVEVNGIPIKIRE